MSERGSEREREMERERGRHRIRSECENELQRNHNPICFNSLDAKIMKNVIENCFQKSL